ncbi:MAG: YegJ family protein [Casimicrobium sp.]
MKFIALLSASFLALSLTTPNTATAKDPDTLVRGGYNQAQMDAGIARARKEVNAFLDVLAKDDADSFSVKAPITDKNGTEHFWLVDITYDKAKATFIGSIGNRPGIVRNVKAGQEWTIKRDEISDWMYTRGEKIHGGYTIDPLLATMPKDQAAAMKAKLVR